MTGELPIYLAAAFLNDRRSQQECLAEFGAKRTQPVDVRQAVRDLRKQGKGSPGLSVDAIFRGIQRMPAEQKDQIRVGMIRTEGKLFLVSNDLVDQLDWTGGLFDGQQ